MNQKVNMTREEEIDAMTHRYADDIVEIAEWFDKEDI